MQKRQGRLTVYDEDVARRPEPSSHLETSFQFLNRADGDYWGQVRKLVQEWMDEVPDDAYNDLRGRLRSDNSASNSAFFELYLHHVFTRAGFVVTIHPKVAGGTRRPDFLVEGDAGAVFVEATMPGTQPIAAGRANRRGAFFDSIQAIHNQDFYLSIEQLVVGDLPAPGRKVRTKIDRWLDTLDPDAPIAYHNRSQFHWKEDGWDAVIGAFPVPVECRGRPDHRPIGIYGYGAAAIVDDAPTIHAALASKASAYGELEHPLFLAVGTYIWDPDRWHATNALYGSCAIEWHENEDGTIGTQREIRKPDGYFGTLGKWKNQGVAAVLHINQLQPSHVQRAEATLWPHPGASNGLSLLRSTLPFTTIVAQGGRLHEMQASQSAASFLGLPEDWPRGDPFPRYSST